MVLQSIRVDVGALGTIGASAKTIALEFEGANTNSNTIAGAVGHGGLSQTVRGFAHDWDDKRQKFIDALKAFSEASLAVADAWIKFDQDGANTLNGQGSTGGGSAGAAGGATGGGTSTHPTTSIA
ncbi:hypothetical protein ABYF32_01935 [Buchananella felis]|uniref:hypothetical protein n=1 Tax=Buchananella felis TaxID=3231492 RepID=UPI003528CEA5